MSKKLNKKQMKSAKGGRASVPDWTYGARAGNGVVIVTAKRTKKSADADAVVAIK